MEESAGTWDSDVHITTGSPRVIELTAVVCVFKQWAEPINIITDSAYVAGIVM